MNKIYINWEDLDNNWEDVNVNWEDVYIIEEVKRLTGNGSLIDYKNPWIKIKKELGEEKTDKFIKVFCKINDMEYEDVKKVKNVKITAKHFNRVFNQIKIGIKK